ncbi:uncharacterized protein LOC131015547 [Salvia miltiorrhiza]|uniref:uncharacterized protein LOC131015547 n=1 Tax=Salvia miltiorrhiza TaxID=226208 RepID=UPI0025ABF6DD|nr:uncharacterized protein LOC131015547 [Salvia miltiorrhiza]
MGRNIDDYLKAAQLLMFYQMVLCRDDIPIERWVWALVEDIEEWNDFPWGAYSFQVLCHYISLLPKKPEHIANKKKTYHFFGPVWALQIWAYEAIPYLGHLCGIRDREVKYPRCLRWTTTSSAADYQHFFEYDLKVNATLEPDEWETNELYFLSLDTQNPLYVRYVPSQRHAFKKGPIVDRMAKTADKMKCRDTSKVQESRHHTKHTRSSQQPIVESVRRQTTRAASKRRRKTSPYNEQRRSESAQEEPKPQFICCQHGLPCKHSREDEDILLSRLGQRVVQHLLMDDSETGWIARLAQRVAEHTRHFVAPRRSSPPPVHDQHVDDASHISDHDQQDPIQVRRSSTPQSAHVSHRRPRASPVRDLNQPRLSVSHHSARGSLPNNSVSQRSAEGSHMRDATLLQVDTAESHCGRGLP